ncbi:MAG: hypothetical protein LLG01_15885 [Planctomycetaceae bacterium]|nr:hypothetical protein [Planctomycetaceae bacterium]
MAAELAVAIRENAVKPKQAAVDGISTQQHSLIEQIEADKYLAGKEAASRNPAKAFTRVKIVPPGTA